VPNTGLLNHRLLNHNDVLLLVIDMQEKLLPAMTNQVGLRENMLKLVKCFRIMDLPVVLTEQQKLGGTIPEIRDELIDAAPIPKFEFNCFSSSAFQEQIRQSRKSNLIIAGIEAHICVAQTALHALFDYRVHVVTDAVSSRSDTNYRVALKRMAQAGVTLSSVEMVVFELLEKAGTNTFKEILKIIK